MSVSSEEEGRCRFVTLPRLERSKRKLARLKRQLQSRLSSTSRSRTPPWNRMAKRSRLESLEGELQRLRERLGSRSQGSANRARGSGDELSIPPFDPDSDRITVEQWIRQVDHLAVQYDWDDRTIMRLIVSRLRKRAKSWLETRRGKSSTWRETKLSLVRRFRRSVPVAKILKEAVNLEARPGQRLGDYCSEKLARFEKLTLDMPDWYLIDLVIDGVPNATIAHLVRSANLTDVNELCAHMSAMGCMPRGNDGLATSGGAASHSDKRKDSGRYCFTRRNRGQDAKTRDARRQRKERRRNEFPITERYIYRDINATFASVTAGLSYQSFGDQVLKAE